MDKVLNKVLVIDGSYMLARQLHVPSLFELKSHTGEGSGGIFGFIKSLMYELRKCGDYYPIVMWDGSLAPRRVAADPYYKHADERAKNKDKVLVEDNPDDAYLIQYRRQRALLMELLTYFGIPSIKYDGYEGDDLIYISTRIAEDSLVLTDDRDMLQLLSYSCQVRRPMADELWTYDEFLDSRGFNNIYDFILCKAISGDGSDNIPSAAKGIGAASINEFIKLVYKFMDTNGKYDFSSYPATVESMKEFCADNNIKYKKAYLNFDSDRFLTNLELVDLNKVDIEERIVRSMVTTFTNIRSEVDYFKAMNILHRLDIKEISADELMQNVSMRYHNLLVNNEE